MELEGFLFIKAHSSDTKLVRKYFFSVLTNMPFSKNVIKSDLTQRLLEQTYLSLEYIISALLCTLSLHGNAL